MSGIISAPNITSHPRTLTETAKIKASLSPERYRDFHSGKSILIVDDNAETAQRLHRNLSELYSNVEFVTDPKKALSKISKAKASGKPYDLLVLDLYMPNLTGAALMKALGENLPATVVNSASMMAPVISDISAQLSTYTSSSAQACFDQLTSIHGKSVPLIAPVLIHHKFSPLTDLVDKIDTALLIQKFSPAAANEFAATFNPRLIEKNISAESVHHFCETVRNLELELRSNLHFLRSECDLEATTWWKQNSAQLFTHLQKLSDARFTTCYKETPQQTDLALHTILFHVQCLTIVGEVFSGPQSTQVGDARLIEWNATINKIQPVLSAMRSDLQSHQKGEFNFNAFLKDDLALRVHYYDESDGNMVRHFPDKSGNIRNLLTKLVRTFNDARGKFDNFKAGWGEVSASLVREDTREFDDPKTKKRLDEINCGAYFKFTFTGSRNLYLEELFSQFLPDISELKKSRLTTFNFSPGGEQDWFELVIKVSEQSIDFEKRANEAAKVGKDGKFQITTKYGRLDAWRKENGNGPLIVLDRLPDPKEAYRYVQSGAFIEYEGEQILSFGSSHSNAAFKMADYFAFKAKQAGLSGERWNDQFARQELYRRCTRITASNRTYYIECDEESAEHLKVSSAFEALGISADRVEGDNSKFVDRPL